MTTSTSLVARLACATATAAHGTDPDEPLLLAAFADAGVEAVMCDWDDPAVDWSSFDRVVLRSTWDYPERLDEFLAWLSATAECTEVVNDLTTVQWSLDKHYLARLAADGVAITPTRFLEPGDPVVLDLDRRPAGFVVKPAVGAGSRDAARYEASAPHLELAVAHVDRLLDAGRSVLLQPFLASIGDRGEWPHVFLDGRLSHVAHKRVQLPTADLVGGLFAVEDNRTAPTEADLVAEAERAMAVVVADVGVPRYARIDMVRDDDGVPCVLEVELVEPSLFLAENPDALARTARALAAR